jgi:hypothetical protein
MRSTIRLVLSLGSKAILAAAGISAACSASPTLVEERGLVPGSGGTGGTTFDRSGTGGGGGKGFDDSPVIRAVQPPRAVSGGTLLASTDGTHVIVADADRDRVLIVDIARHVVEKELALGAGAEPGRLVEDASGRVHVALRGSGELVSVDIVKREIVGRRAICAAPRGVAYDPSADSVLVACVEGTLVELPAAGGAATRVTELVPDLRDVVIAGDRVVVTLFREAALLFLDAERKVEKRVKLPGRDGFEADVAWRATALGDGSIAVVHQRAFDGRINVAVEPSGAPGSGGTGGAGGTASIDVSQGQAGAGGTGAPADVDGGAGVPGQGEAGAAGEPGTFEVTPRDGYGSTFEPCGAVVVSAVSLVRPDGEITAGPSLNGVLPVDVSVASTGAWAVAFAGARPDTTTLGVYVGAELTGDSSETTCVFSNQFAPGPALVAVAFMPSSSVLVAQRREDATLLVMDLWSSTTTEVPLGGNSAADTGHQLFHLDAGGGLACASCHPEGTDDGRVWNFSDFGPRRTQPLDVGLFGTAPFHWDATLTSFGDLMDSIFRERMGGPTQSEPRVQALEEYVYALPRRPASRSADDARAVRGKALFESRAVGCSTCHNGPNLSSGASADIGRGEALQIPSLIAVSTRAPYMHDGCATTLLERFDPKCGGTEHGDSSSLTPSDLDDLVAYLETL